MRPLANVNGSSLDGIDWIVSKILNQGIRLVQYNVWNAQQIIHQIPIINNSPPAPSSKRRVLSLDVVGLYPSIPIWEGINKVGNFIRQHTHLINTFGIPLQKFMDMLRLLAHEYTISFEGMVFKQTKGVAMGARFACAFAVLYMHVVEGDFIDSWYKSELGGMSLVYYGRYIDDILLIIDDQSGVSTTEILDRFNNLDRAIKFTIEEGTYDDPLAFLDMVIWPDQGGMLQTGWYIKPTHSRNFLAAHTFAPPAVKYNTMVERFRAVMVRSSSLQVAIAGLSGMINILSGNGYDPIALNCALVKAYKKNNNTIYYDPQKMVDNHQQSCTNTDELVEKEVKAVLRLPFLGGSLGAEVRDICSRFGVTDSIRIVYPSQQRIKFLKGRKPNPNPDHTHLDINHCPICKHFANKRTQNTFKNENNKEPKYNCQTKVVVYKLSCVICTHFYVGKTNRKIRDRMGAHLNLFRNKSTDSVLYNHERTFHAGSSPTNMQGFFDYFSLDILHAQKGGGISC